MQKKGNAQARCERRGMDRMRTTEEEFTARRHKECDSETGQGDCMHALEGRVVM